MDREEIVQLLNEFTNEEDIALFMDEMFEAWVATCNETGVTVCDRHILKRTIINTIKLLLTEKD